MQVALVVLYPILVHLSVLLSLPMLQAVALISLAMGLTYQGLKNRNVFLWTFLVIFSAAILPLATIDMTLYLLYVPPIALPLLLAVVFINTLLPGREALVTAIGEASRGPLSEEMRRYTKAVTIMWATFFVIMIIEAIVLVIIGDAHLWSWMTSIVNYILIGVLFLGEFLFRKVRFPDHPHPTFIDYIKIVISANVSKR